MKNNRQGIDLSGSEGSFTANQYVNDYAAGSFKVRSDYLPLVKKVLIPQYQILERGKELLKQIEEDFQGEQPLFIPILKGAVRFAIDIFRFAGSIDPEFEFMSAASYGTRLSSGKVQLDLRAVSRLLDKLKDRHRPVIIMEDIVDTGNTLSHIVSVLRNIDEMIDSQPDFREFQRKGSYVPSAVSICTLLDKPSRRMKENEGLPLAYTGFVVPNLWVFGYGLDVWNDRGRTLDHVCIIADDYGSEEKLAEFFEDLENGNP
ncbi:MAG: phosphoribosyltransferase family protein [Pseudomonadota bacterium]